MAAVSGPQGGEEGRGCTRAPWEVLKQLEGRQLVTVFLGGIAARRHWAELHPNSTTAYSIIIATREIAVRVIQDAIKGIGLAGGIAP